MTKSEKIHALKKQGLSKSAIADQAGCSFLYVSRVLGDSKIPEGFDIWGRCRRRMALGQIVRVE